MIAVKFLKTAQNIQVQAETSILMDDAFYR